ncbi:MAG: DUF2141 domain-containing protein [Maribacter sp.]|nr:DUF2141 domain-containing protein [Maribacter sp.]MBT8315560.1 DUF2141 domain-containing protein [Maribacter sp.]NNK17514.1 DUF2141 domain-containing protein [Maribacter sp.]
MKTAGLILALVLTNLVATAQEIKGVNISVTIENVLSDDGKIIGALHSTETFLKGPGIMNEVINATKGEVVLTFSGVAPGTYAIMILHDGNNNNRMDYETNGMPKESYATSGSNEPYGPPNFDMAKFEVADEDLEFKIRF